MTCDKLPRFPHGSDAKPGPYSASSGLERGDAEARDKLWPLVFVELERLASAYIRQERPGHTLEPHALINELYVRLDAWNSAQWINRSHFFGMCARMMRQILVDYARTRTRQRRGGDVERIVLDDAIVFQNRNASN